MGICMLKDEWYKVAKSRKAKLNILGSSLIICSDESLTQSEQEHSKYGIQTQFCFPLNQLRF